MKRAELLQHILETRKADANLRELTSAWMSQWGGVDGIAKEAKLLYDACQSQSEKTKLILAGIDLVKMVAAANKGVESDPTKNMSDEEITGALETLFSGTE